MAMGHLQQQMRDLAGLVRGIDSLEFPARLRDFLTGHLTFSTFLIVVFPPDRVPYSPYHWIPEPRLDAIFKTQYLRGAYLLDPFYQRSQRDFDDSAHRLCDTVPDRFFSSEYYREYYATTAIIDEVGFLTRLTNGAVGHLSISRSNRDNKFDRKTLQYLNQMAPMFTELLRQHCEHCEKNTDESPQPVSDENTQLAHRSLDEVIYDFAFSLRPKGLTKREAGVTALILQGHSSASASLVLGISCGTANVHRRNIHRKLKISSQAELFAIFRPAMSGPSST